MGELADRVIPCPKPGLAAQAERGVPRAVVAVEQPAPACVEAVEFPAGRAKSGIEGCPEGQNRPSISPSSPRVMDSAAGTRGRPGMVMMSPQIATTKPAPADRRTSRTGKV